MSNIYLSLSYKNYHLGAAFYDEESEAIHILNDVVEDEEFTSLSTRKSLIYITLLLLINYLPMQFLSYS